MYYSFGDTFCDRVIKKLQKFYKNRPILTLSLIHSAVNTSFFVLMEGGGWVGNSVSYKWATSKHNLNHFLTKETSFQYKGNESSLLKLAGGGIRNIKETNPANVLRHRTGRQCLQVYTHYRLTISRSPPIGSATASLTVSIPQTVCVRMDTAILHTGSVQGALISLPSNCTLSGMSKS